MGVRTPAEVDRYLRSFTLGQQDGSIGGTGGTETLVDQADAGGRGIPRYTNEFWTARQRQAARIHEISYRACFKPQLPGFFIRLLTSQGDVVYDPFSGRGTTPLEAGLLGRRVCANDINPLSRILTLPRFTPPAPGEVKDRLATIPSDPAARADQDLSMFYHPDTEAEIVSLRTYLLSREQDGTADHLDRWIRMVATNRLTGHSPGFFSVYTLPPNQAVTPDRQIRINKQRSQTPPYRDTKERILKKTRILTKDLTAEEKNRLRAAGESVVFLTGDARFTPSIPDETISLTVTSPPFLDIVQYSTDNWLRCWFNGIPAADMDEKITCLSRVRDWADVMKEVFLELFRITTPGGWVAFEVGEVKNGTVHLDEIIVPVGIAAGFTCPGIVINRQDFTKTANIWGISNMQGGTNTNRIVLFWKNG